MKHILIIEIPSEDIIGKASFYSRNWVDPAWALYLTKKGSTLLFSLSPSIACMFQLPAVKSFFVGPVFTFSTVIDYKVRIECLYFGGTWLRHNVALNYTIAFKKVEWSAKM